MKREELKVIDLLCDMGLDVNGQRHYQPWKAYDIDEVNLVIKELEAKNERLKAELKQTEAQDQVVIDALRKENAKLKCTVLHAMSEYFGYKTLFSNKKTNRTKYGQFANKFYEAYRKAKKELMEAK